jgi:hypothetical protein
LSSFVITITAPASFLDIHLYRPTRPRACVASRQSPAASPPPSDDIIVSFFTSQKEKIPSRLGPLQSVSLSDRIAFPSHRAHRIISCRTFPPTTVCRVAFQRIASHRSALAKPAQAHRHLSTYRLSPPASSYATIDRTRPPISLPTPTFLATAEDIVSVRVSPTIYYRLLHTASIPSIPLEDSNPICTLYSCLALETKAPATQP